MSKKPIVLSGREQSFVNEIKDHIFKLASYQCTSLLTDFNDCRETGLKKDTKIKQIKDEEQKYFLATKGCYDEYKNYYNCINNLVNIVSNTKEVSSVFTQKGLSFNKSQFKEMILDDYKLI